MGSGPTCGARYEKRSPPTACASPPRRSLDGRFQVVVMGDLVHYKDFETYARAVGEEYYDPKNPEQLKRAAKAQIRELYRFKRYVDKAQGNVTVILGNHDEAASRCTYNLSTRGGLSHDEFRRGKGRPGSMPQDLAEWLQSFVREHQLLRRAVRPRGAAARDAVF